MNVSTRRQRGASMLVILFVLLILGVVFMMFMRVGPIYLENFTIRSALEGLAEDPQAVGMSEREIRKRVDRRFDVNSITTVSHNDLDIQRERDGTVVTLDYEVRKLLIGNLDVVASFHEQVVLPAR